MNEATFEAHLATTLATLLPTVASSRIVAQPVFTIRLGKRVFTEHCAASFAAGRADVAVHIDEQPTLMVELKAPDVALTDDDVSQGISYARLHEPMIPILVVTNGSDTQIYSVFDRSALHGDTLDELRITAVLRTSARQAVLSREEAIRSLLEGSPSVWAKALRTRSEEALAELEGDLDDLEYPLCRQFQLPRKATVQLAHALSKGERSVALVGPPISGKTNVLAELCRRSEEFDFVPLYVDCLQASDLLAEVSYALTDSFGASVPANKVYDWLRIGIGDTRQGRPRVVLILDSLTPQQSEQLIKQASTLVRNTGPNVGILMALTETALETVRFAPGRTTLTKLGRDTKVLVLQDLDDDEIGIATHNLAAAANIELPSAYSFDAPMRQPRILRLMVASDDSLRDVPAGMHGRVPSIVPTDVLKELWRRTGSATQLQADLSELAEAYTHDLDVRSKSAELTLISHGIGAISLKTAQKTMTQGAIDRLTQQGHVKQVSGAGQMLLVPTVPELLGAATIPVLKAAMHEANKSAGASAAGTILQQQTIGLPLGDRVAALALQTILPENPALFSSIFGSLMDDEPRREPLKEGSFLMQLPTGDPVEMTYVGDSLRIRTDDGRETVIPLDRDDEESSTVTVNLHPWNILSHLAYAALGFVREGATVPLGPIIMQHVGRFRSTLKNFGPAQATPERAAIYEHSLPGFGSVPCPARGIVEPIVYAMQLGFLRFGETMEELAAAAITQGDPAFLMRLYVAASSLQEIADPEVKRRSVRTTNEISAALDKVFEVIHPLGSDESQQAPPGKAGDTAP